MLSAIAASLEEIHQSLERCIKQEPGKQGIIEFYAEIAALKGESLLDVLNKVNLVSKSILNTIRKIKQMQYRGCIPVDVIAYSEALQELSQIIEQHWNLFTPELKNKFQSLGEYVNSFNLEIKGFTGFGIRVKLLAKSIASWRNLFKVYTTANQKLAESILTAANKESILFEDEELRAIAYSMDILVPGLYIWLPKIRVRLGGCLPDDNPYRYPGTIHSSTGIALVLPGYRIFTTYQGTYDPQQTLNSRTFSI